jgi:hypothetical protein
MTCSRKISFIYLHNGVVLLWTSAFWMWFHSITGPHRTKEENV